MSESRSIGICQICSECKGTVVQGLCCVGWCRDITLMWSSQKPEKMCLISSHEVAKFCATPLTNVQSWESAGLMVCWASVSDVWVERVWRGDIRLVKACSCWKKLWGQAFFYKPSPMLISLVNALQADLHCKDAKECSFSPQRCEKCSRNISIKKKKSYYIFLLHLF